MFGQPFEFSHHLARLVRREAADAAKLARTTRSSSQKIADRFRKDQERRRQTRMELGEP